VLVSSAPYVDQPRTPERGEMNKAEKSLNILPKSMRWAPELLAAHSEFCAEIRQRIGDADQHARVPSGSLHPSDDFEKSGSYWSNFRSVNPTELKLLHLSGCLAYVGWKANYPTAGDVS